MLFVQILCYIISVHRDPKPNNTLLSVPDASDRVRAKIADFGLSKAIKTGRVSVSRALDWSCRQIQRSQNEETFSTCHLM